MVDYESELIKQFKNGKDIIIDLNKIGILTYLERKLREIANCTFNKYGDKVICKRVKKYR